MNAKDTRSDPLSLSANPVRRLLGVFEEHPEIDAIVVYASPGGPAEARALDRRGRKVDLDARRALGERAWRKLSEGAQCGAPIVVARKDAEEQSRWIFGAREAARHERDLLGASTPEGAADRDLRAARL